MSNVYIIALGFLVLIYLGLAVFLTYTARKFFLREPEKNQEKRYKLIVKSLKSKSEKPSSKKKAA
jgi:hypothetical protein